MVKVNECNSEVKRSLGWLNRGSRKIIAIATRTARKHL
jgi:hypothetical protein